MTTEHECFQEICGKVINKVTCSDSSDANYTETTIKFETNEGEFNFYVYAHYQKLRIVCQREKNELDRLREKVATYLKEENFKEEEI
jgi:hypothetical protein